MKSTSLKKYQQGVSLKSNIFVGMKYVRVYKKIKTDCEVV